MLIVIQVPTSAADLVDQVKATNVNTFSLTQVRAALTKIDANTIAANPIVYGLVFGMAGACALSLLLFFAKDHREEQQRKERLAEDDSVKAAAIVRSERILRALKMPIKNSFKQLLARGEEDAAVTRAAVAIQRHLRGRSERKKVRTLMDFARNAKEIIHKGIAAISREIYARVKSDHSVLGLWFGDAKEATRAELAQRFWNTCMLGLVIECMLYSPPSADPASGAVAAPPPSPPAGGIYVQINVVATVVNSLITGVIMLPALWVFSAVFAWGSGRASPIAERFAAALLGGEQAEDDAQLANRARSSAYACAPKATAADSSRFKPTSSMRRTSPSWRTASSASSSTASSGAYAFRSRSSPDSVMADALKSHSRQATEKEQKASAEVSERRASVDSRLPVDEDRAQWTSAFERQPRPPIVGSASSPVVSINGSRRYRHVSGAIVVPVTTDASLSLITPNSTCAKLSLRCAGVTKDSTRANAAAGTTEPGSDGPQNEPPQPPPAGPPEPTLPQLPPKLASNLSSSPHSLTLPTEQLRSRSSSFRLSQVVIGPPRTSLLYDLGLRRRTNSNPSISCEEVSPVAEAMPANGLNVVSVEWSRVLTPVKAHTARVTRIKLRRRSDLQNPSAARQARALRERMSLDSVVYDLDEATVTLLRTKFAKFDKDHSGSVSVKELSGLMTDLGNMPILIPPPSLLSPIHTGFHLSQRGILKLQRELDPSGEGLVSLQELVHWYNMMVDNAIERERKRQTGWRKHLARVKRACTLPPHVRLVVAWLLMWGLFAALSMLAVVYSAVFGHETTKLMLFSWCIACAHTFTIEVRTEPYPRPACARVATCEGGLAHASFAAPLRRPQEPTMISMSILLPWLGEQLTSNVLVGRIVTKLVSPVISGCQTVAGWFFAAQ
ncbi:hypothetical protein T492DRAFT_1117319 [Pavlovales sp. CCMP2436]|nr:hypothetical protein T492DRAFT_1117319 [Pavlovales sp. CCMP2436]